MEVALRSEQTAVKVFRVTQNVLLVLNCLLYNILHKWYDPNNKWAVEKSPFELGFLILDGITMGLTGTSFMRILPTNIIPERIKPVIVFLINIWMARMNYYRAQKVIKQQKAAHDHED